MKPPRDIKLLYVLHPPPLNRGSRLLTQVRSSGISSALKLFAEIWLRLKTNFTVVGEIGRWSSELTQGFTPTHTSASISHAVQRGESRFNEPWSPRRRLGHTINISETFRPGGPLVTCTFKEKIMRAMKTMYIYKYINI